MSKRNFIDLADRLKVLERRLKYLNEDVMVMDLYRDMLADFCQAQNPRFDRQRWLDYIAGQCGPSGGKVPKTSAKT